MKSLEIKIQISMLDDSHVIDSEVLASLLSTTRDSIYVMRARRLLPPTLGGVFGKKLVWRLGSVRDWIKEQEASKECPASVARRGRPRSESHTKSVATVFRNTGDTSK